MPRLFSYANVAALAEGESCFVNDSLSTVKRKCALYGARNAKRFRVERMTAMYGGAPYARVIREPVTDTELPGA